jgi:hypothetical protein
MEPGQAGSCMIGNKDAQKARSCCNCLVRCHGQGMQATLVDASQEADLPFGPGTTQSFLRQSARPWLQNAERYHVSSQCIQLSA